MRNSTQREILAGVTGVWHGTYRTLTADGELVEEFASRQETRLVEDRWYERIVYLKDPAAPKVLDFRASFDAAGDLVFDDDRFHGQLYAPTPDVLMFDYTWKDQPDVRVVETITLRLPDAKFRIWQRFVGNALETLTIIQEHRDTSATPEEWW